MHELSSKCTETKVPRYNPVSADKVDIVSKCDAPIFLIKMLFLAFNYLDCSTGRCCCCWCCYCCGLLRLVINTESRSILLNYTY